MNNKIARAIIKLAKDLIAAGLPAKNYPPGNVSAWINMCNEYDRKDLGDKIMQGWNNMIAKYPKARVNWRVAVPIGNSSIKKNVFGGKKFEEWFSIQVGESVDVNIPEPKSQGSGVGVPRAGETPEDFLGASTKTAAMLVDIDQAFDTANELVDYLKKEVGDIERKIADYGEGGKKEFTKSGAPSSFSKRIPKWRGQLQAYSDKLDQVSSAVKKSEKTMSDAKKSYDTAPPTVAFEEGMQDALDIALERILNMEDLEKQQAMLLKFKKMATQLDNQKVASLREAGIFDTLFSAFDKFVTFLTRGWKSVANWARGVVGSTNQVNNWASKAGR